MEADDKGLVLVDVKSGSLKVYILIDPDTEEILDTKFFTYGGPILTAFADILCENLLGKKINEIESSFAEFQTIAKLQDMITQSYPNKKNIALAAKAAMGGSRDEADEEWKSLSEAQKLEKIEECLNEYVRAMLAGDGGGLELLGIKDEKIVQIRYNGACAGCGAASGGTLYYIENQLQRHVYYNLTVEPEMPSLDLGGTYEY